MALLDRSDRTVRHAYARMAMDERHAWARQAPHEVDVAVGALGLVRGSRVIDVGCGRGRHARLLAQRGCVVVGVDFVEAFVAQAGAQAVTEGIDGVTFVAGDARTVDVGPQRYDAALCLYDVIGTFAERV